MISMEYEAFHREPTRKVACPHCSGLIEFYYYSGMGDLARKVQISECLPSGRFQIVEVQHTTEAFSAVNWIVD